MKHAVLVLTACLALSVALAPEAAAQWICTRCDFNLQAFEHVNVPGPVFESTSGGVHSAPFFGTCNGHPIDPTVVCFPGGIAMEDGGAVVPSLLGGEGVARADLAHLSATSPASVRFEGGVLEVLTCDGSWHALSTTRAVARNGEALELLDRWADAS